MAYAKRTDANQTEIVETLRKAGADVYILSMVGKGIQSLTSDDTFWVAIEDCFIF